MFVLCKLGGGSLADTFVGLGKTLEKVKRNQMLVRERDRYINFGATIVVVVGRNFVFVEVGEGMAWWARRMRGVMEFSNLK